MKTIGYPFMGDLPMNGRMPRGIERVTRTPLGPSGTYVESSFTYDSTVTAAATSLYAEYTYDTGWNGFARPVLVIMHGWAEDVDHVPQSLCRRMAGYGFFVLVVGMRGRNGAGSSRDASAKEVYDIYEALVYARANLSAHLSSTSAAIVGYSGGGGNAHACMAKLPDTFHTVVCYFGPCDYGYDSEGSWYFLNPAFQATIAGSVFYGAPSASSLHAYHARAHDIATPYQTALYDGTTKDGPCLIALHDSADASVSVTLTDNLEDAMLAAGQGSRFAYYRSTPSDSQRYTHGYPSTEAGNLAGEDYWWRRARYAEPWNVAASGTAWIAGWLRMSPKVNGTATPVEIWIAPTDADTPKTWFVGGAYDAALCTYSVTGANSGSFTITTQNKNAKVTCYVGNASTTSTCTANVATVITV